MVTARALLIAVALAACGGARPPVAAPPAPVPVPPQALWEYRVDPSAAPRLSVVLEITGGGSADLVVGAPIDVLEVQREGAWVPVAAPDGRASVPECARACVLRYVIDLRDAEGGLDGAMEVGRSAHAWLTPGYAWLLHPAPLPAHVGEGARVTVRFDGPMGEKSSASPGLAAAPWVTGLPREGASHAFPAWGFGEAGFTAFGRVRHRVVVASDAEIDLAILGDEPLALGDDGALAWATEAARAVTTVYGRFPVPRVAVFAVPVAGRDEVLFGKVLSLGGPSIATLVGTAMTKDDVAFDWVLVHEMMHLGFPTLPGEGRWLTEGLATYYEPIARSRAGIRRAEKVWAGFAEDMHRARPRGRERALERRGDIDSIYWGGALFCLMADVRIRERTAGAQSLDTVLQGILAKGGDSRSVWRLERIIAEGDRMTGTTVLRELADRYAFGEDDVDPQAELAALGVRPDGTLDDGAPRAALRRAITAASPAH